MTLGAGVLGLGCSYKQWRYLVFYISIIWYGIPMLWYAFSLLCFEKFKMIWNGTLSFGMVCYEIWGNVPPFTEEFQYIYTFRLIYRLYISKKKSTLVTVTLLCSSWREIIITWFDFIFLIKRFPFCQTTKTDF